LLKRTNIRTIVSVVKEFMAVYMKGWLWWSSNYFLGFVGTIFSATIFYFLACFIGPAASPHLLAYRGDYIYYVLLGIGFSSLMASCLGLFQAILCCGERAGRLEIYMTEPIGLKAYSLATMI
jgi:hypothetical protein